MACLEAVPNISEGRRGPVIDACARAIREAGPSLLDVSSDPTHHRSVLTLAGEPAAVASGILALYDVALAAIDLRTHAGGHPRVGAVDVVPLVPLARVTMADCVALARQIGQIVAERHDVPVFLYEDAAASPHRRDLAEIRRGGLDGLTARLVQPGWAPDFGPRRPHPTAGITVIGARRPLIAFNVNLATRDLEIARRIARKIRASSGGLPAVKAIGVDLPRQGVVQVSMNLTDFQKTSVADAFEAVATEARSAGIEVVESELVGLAPAVALPPAVAAHVRLRRYSDQCLLDTRLRASGLALDGPVTMVPSP